MLLLPWQAPKMRESLLRHLSEGAYIFLPAYVCSCSSSKQVIILVSSFVRLFLLSGCAVESLSKINNLVWLKTSYFKFCNILYTFINSCIEQQRFARKRVRRHIYYPKFSPPKKKTPPFTPPLREELAELSVLLGISHSMIRRRPVLWALCSKCCALITTTR